MVHSQTTATRKKIAKAMTGRGNSQYRDGRRSYRRIVDAKPGQGVDHKNNDSKDNRPSNLKIYNLKGKSRAEHEKKHKRFLNTQMKSHAGRQKVPRGYVAKRG